MNTVHKKIDSYFEKFIYSKLKFKVMTIKVRKRIGFEYDFDYVDEWDSTGWILHKPFFSRKAKLYMFKGKAYTPLKFPPTRWYQFPTRIGQAFEDLLHPPDRKMRNRAELRIVFGYIRLVMVLGIIATIIFFPQIKSKLVGEPENEVGAITQNGDQQTEEQINEETNPKEVDEKDSQDDNTNEKSKE